MFVGLVLTLAVFLIGALAAEKHQIESIVGIIMISTAVMLFRLWMILEWMMFPRIRTFSVTPRGPGQIHQILINRWTEVGFAIAIPAACILVIYVDTLRFGPTRLVILGVRCSCLKLRRES
jgi:hypothetical protein